MTCHGLHTACECIEECFADLIEAADKMHRFINAELPGAQAGRKRADRGVGTNYVEALLRRAKRLG